MNVDQAHVIKQYIVGEFLTDASVDQLRDDYDLLANGVIDSLGLLRLIAWLEERFGIAIDDVDIAPEHFQTVNAIRAFIAGAAPHTT